MARGKGGDTPSVRWGLMEQALQVFSPARALHRYQSKVVAAQLRRKYEAADKGRGSDGWRTGSTAADSEIAAAGAILRDRMRDLVRNNPLAAQAVQVLVNNMVGPGIRPRAASADQDLNRRVDALFDRWSKQCDAHGHTDFFGLQQLAVREMLEGGEVFALRRAGRRKSQGIAPLELELKEADHLDNGRVNWEQSGARISRGIEYDAQGKRRAYWMFPEHPGDNVPGQWRSITSTRIPAENVAHLFERQRVQSRGVPWGVPAMRALQDLGDWQEAELVRKKIEASAVGVVFGDLDAAQQSMGPVVRDAHGELVEHFEPGMILYAEGGRISSSTAPARRRGSASGTLCRCTLSLPVFGCPMR
jgi:lambda family phage portal protein